MDTSKAAEELKIIRQLMERPIRYSSMSGLSGVLAGCITLCGLAADAAVYGAFGKTSLTTWINLGVWAMVFLLSLAGVLGLTRMRELRQGMPFWTPIKRRILMTILPSFVAGAGLTAAIVYRWYFAIGPNQFGLIPAIWMLFYGVACWQVGEMSIRELRVMGAAFIVSGLLAAAFCQWAIPGVELSAGLAPYWTLGITFGGYHIIYGIVVRVRYGG